MRPLPDELLVQIIAYLEPSELVKLQHVSRRFVGLGRDGEVWKQLCFSHSYTERRRSRLEAPLPSPPAERDAGVAGRREAANSLAATLDMAAQRSRKQERRRAALRKHWDPSGLDEKVDWYDEFVQRHAPEQIRWFEGAGHGGDERRREATGAGLLFEADGLASHVVAPLDDGSISLWDARAHSSGLGKLVAQTDAGLLSGSPAQSQAVMTDTGAVECVSIDSTLHTAYLALHKTLVHVDLNTLQVVSRTPYPFPLTALSEARDSTPLTVGTNWTLHLHDARTPAPSSSPHLAAHVSLTQPALTRWKASSKTRTRTRTGRGSIVEKCAGRWNSRRGRCGG